MRIKITSLFVLFIVAQIAFSQTKPNYGIRLKEQSVKAITNATIIVSPDKTIENGTIIFENGLIISVGTDIEIPADVFQIDLTGYTVYPGFIDPFTNYGVEKFEGSAYRGRNASPQFEPIREGGSAANNAIHAEVNWVDSFTPQKSESDRFIKNGYTIVQSAKKDGIFRGRSFVTLLGEGDANDLILNPFSQHYLAFNKGSSIQANPGSLMGSIALLRQTFYDTDWYRKATTAYAQNPNQKKPEFNSAIEAISGFNGSYIFEPEDELSLLRAEKIASEFDLDLIYVGSNYEYTIIDQLKQIGATLILPLNFPVAPAVSTFEDALYVTLGELRHWETAPYNAAILEQNEIPFALTSTTDSKSFFKNLRKAVKFGLSESTALRALTVMPSIICGIESKAGTIEKGKYANFVITNGNIFQKHTNIKSVWIAGNEHSIERIESAEFEGTYSLSTEFDAVLYLKRKGSESDEYSGKLILQSDTLSLKDVFHLENQLSFIIEPESESYEGVFRFSGRKENNTITGNVVFPDGKTHSWTAILNEPSENTGGTDTESETENEKSITPEIRISNLTFPNKAFGRTGLPEQQNLIIKNITVWTSEDEGILENTDVIIKDGNINDIGKNLSTPKGFIEIDGSGKHLTAGIIDEHSHIAISGGVNECTDVVTAEVRIGDVVSSNSISIYRQLSGGVTTSHLLHGSCNAIGGQAQLIKLRWGADPDGLKYENAFPSIKCALGENVKRSSWGAQFRNRYPLTRMGVEAIMRDEFQTAKEYQTKLAAYNKLSSRLKENTIPPRKDLELDAVSEILNSQRDIHCHSYVQSEILMLMRLAEQYNFKVQAFTHILEGYKVADEMAKHGAAASGFSDWWAYKFEVYDAIPYNIALMTEKGVTASVNSDNSDLARRLNQEAAKSIQYGNMTQEEAIKLCTINPAISLRIDHEVGSIKKGKVADFVIWNGNPLSVYSSVEQTWIEGRKYFDRENDLLEREKIAQEKNALIQKILSSKAKQSKTYKKDYKHEEPEYDCEDSFDYWRYINEVH